MPATQKIIWSPEEDAHLIKMRLAKFTNQEIADSVRRPRSTVGFRLLCLMPKMTPEQLSAIQRQNLRQNRASLYRDAFVAGPFVQSHREDPFWTQWRDEQIMHLRDVERLSFAAIGEKIGRHQSSVADRIAKIRAGKTAAEKEPTSIADERQSWRLKAQSRPPGPVPKNPGPAPSPHAPWWRKCLGESCGRLFWSASSLNRICQRCKKDGNELVRGGTQEFSLHL
jgi:hypothetical protein